MVMSGEVVTQLLLGEVTDGESRYSTWLSVYKRLNLKALIYLLIQPALAAPRNSISGLFLSSIHVVIQLDTAA